MVHLQTRQSRALCSLMYCFEHRRHVRTLEFERLIEVTPIRIPRGQPNRLTNRKIPVLLWQELFYMNMWFCCERLQLGSGDLYGGDRRRQRMDMRQANMWLWMIQQRNVSSSPGGRSHGAGLRDDRGNLSSKTDRQSHSKFHGDQITVIRDTNIPCSGYITRISEAARHPSVNIMTQFQHVCSCSFG